MYLQKFFNPRSVAIVGVSRDVRKVGHLVARNMLEQGYVGDLYFIHPSGEEILGRKTHPTLAAIGKSVDLVIIAIPAASALSVLDEVAEIGARHVVLFPAGFSETGTPEGKALEQNLRAKIAEHELVVQGPNCIGFINTNAGVNATFFGKKAPQGNIGIISQSGALGSAFLDYVAAKSHLGVSYFVSLGNKLMLQETSVLDFLRDDVHTAVIGMYLEDVRDGDAFRESLLKTTAKKPVIILKSGRTQEGSQAALSHTGSMVGDDEVFSALVRDCGAIRADSYAEFEMLLKLYSHDAVPRNSSILVLSNAGGMGVMLTDGLMENGLRLVTVSEDTAQALADAFTPSKKISVHNPIDLLGDASAYDYRRAFELTAREHDIGGVCILLTPQANTEIVETARGIIGMKGKLSGVPIYPIFMGKDSVTEAHALFEAAGIASFRYFAHLPRALRKMIAAKEAHEAIQTPTIPSDYALLTIQHHHHIERILRSPGSKKSFLNQDESLRVLAYAGIPIAPVAHVVTAEEARDVASRVGYPLVAKIASDKITHKTEVRGVVTGITVEEELMHAFESLSRIGGGRSGCYLQKQLHGHELIIGAKHDRTSGTVLMVGIGGVYAELLGETVEFVYPVSKASCLLALSSSRVGKLLTPFRGMTPISGAHIFEMLMSLGALFERFYPLIEAIDINPAMGTSEGLIAVDARIILPAADH